METNFLMLLQLLADLVLCGAVAVLLVMLNRERNRKRLSAVDELPVAELKRLIEDSRAQADEFVKMLDTGRRELKSVLLAAGEEGRRIRDLVEELTALREGDGGAADGRGREEKYDHVRAMKGKGLSEKEIASILQIPEGEVQLILGLDRRKTTRN